MPMDPFFTSKAKDDTNEKRQKSVAFAKAYQFTKFLRTIPKEKAKAAMKSHLTDRSVRCASVLKGKSHQLLGGPSLTGFKSPEKKWTEHRGSRATPETD